MSTEVHAEVYTEARSRPRGGAGLAVAGGRRTQLRVQRDLGRVRRRVPTGKRRAQVLLFELLVLLREAQRVVCGRYGTGMWPVCEWAATAVALMNLETALKVCTRVRSAWTISYGRMKCGAVSICESVMPWDAVNSSQFPRARNALDSDCLSNIVFSSSAGASRSI